MSGAMGLMHFLVPDRSRLAADAAARAHMSGIDGVPWNCRVVATPAGLIIDRPGSDSGNVHVPWQIEGRGELLLSTASLMERARPYNLAVELARGTLHRLRNQIAAWQNAGMELPESARTRLQEAMHHLGLAVTRQSNPAHAAEEAQKSITTCVELIEFVTGQYVEQVADARSRQGQKLPTLFGASLGDDLLDDKVCALVASTFNTAIVPFTWGQVESVEGQPDWSTTDRQIAWCQSVGMRVCGGPLLQPDVLGLPQWMYLWEDDFANLLTFVSRYVRQVVLRYQGRVHLWHCAARTNTATALALTEEQKLRLTIRAVEAIREVDNRTPVIVSFDQPWAEHMFHHDRELSPLHFADAIVRAELGVAGLGLEINYGYHPRGTLTRDLLAVSYQIDRWSLFSLPLVVLLTIPSSSQPDSQAREKAEPLSGMAVGGLSPESQRVEAERLIPLLLAKQPVQAVIWNQLCDFAPHSFPNGGLVDHRDQPKPAWEALRSLRQRYLT
ncbi:MAG: endo-1,4-beta-xylanase [Pirellulales bacterium]